MQPTRAFQSVSLLSCLLGFSSSSAIAANFQASNTYLLWPRYHPENKNDKLVTCRCPRKSSSLMSVLKRLHSVGHFYSGMKALNTPSTSTLRKLVLDAAIKDYKDGETTDDCSDAEE
ncbi:hypothetical protein C8R45DRAFT_947883 [Mycena sanguinolenta]|nr:hypothetical protein C8R45DRAFT_947883 [Mycena sanguinolenta]